jgi:hypothetical protein
MAALTYIYKQDDFTLTYKRYATPRMSPTGTNITNKGLHITSGMQSVYEPHRDKPNKQRTSHYKRYAKRV